MTEEQERLSRWLYASRNLHVEERRNHTTYEDYDSYAMEMRHRAYYEEQSWLNEQAREGLADAFELDYYDDGCGYDSFDWRD